MTEAVAASLSAPIAVRWALSAAIVLLIVALSVTPAGGDPARGALKWLVTATPRSIQKLMHVLMYSLLSAMLYWASEDIAAPVIRIGFVFVFAVSMGAFLEQYQRKVPGRFGNAGDVLLNAGGTIIGLLVAMRLL